MDKPNKKELIEIKFLTAYCKRMSNLIISSKNNEVYASDKLFIIFDELLKDAICYGIKGVLTVKENIRKTSKETMEIYEIIFTIFENVGDIYAIVGIDNREFKVVLDKDISSSLSEILGKQTANWNVTKKIDEDGTYIHFSKKEVENVSI